MDFALTTICTLWERKNPDGYGGWTWTAPVLIKSRWEYKMELVVTFTGEQRMSATKVFVNRDIKPGSYLYQGISTKAKPTDQPDAWQVLTFRKIPNINGTIFEQVVWLSQ